MIKCPACATENPPEADFCFSCGSPLRAKPVSASEQATLQGDSTPVSGDSHEASDTPPAPESSIPLGSPVAPSMRVATIPPNPVPPPPAQAAFLAPYTPPPAYGQPPYMAYAQRPPKDRSIALILEILPDLFGLFGFGWIYAGNTSAGLMWLVGMLFWDFIAIVIGVLTGGFGCFCTIPVNLVLTVVSASSLNAYTKQHPELFGN